jgi:hypothetical protein
LSTAAANFLRACFEVSSIFERQPVSCFGSKGYLQPLQLM